MYEGTDGATPPLTESEPEEVMEDGARTPQTP